MAVPVMREGRRSVILGRASAAMTDPTLTPHRPLCLQYSAEHPVKPWRDQCLPDPKLQVMSNPPDTRPYCTTMAKLVRLKVRSSS